MPITSELENARRLKSVGFTEAQAETLVELMELAQQKGFEKFVEVLERGIGELKADMNMRFGELRGEIGGVRVELHSSLRDQILKIVTIFVGVMGIALAIFKFFPNLPR